MNNICTVSDINYLHQGLTLYESLLNKNQNFVLHYLCIDDLTYEKIKKNESINLIAHHVKDLTDKDDVLLKLKFSDYKYFCWSLASYFSNFLLNKGLESILYIDSDVFFHEDINYLYEKIGKNEIGIFRHRQFDLSIPRPEGWFNVGVVYFKNGEIGVSISNWWKDAVLYKKYPHLSTCGDQKYLDEFPKMCQNDYILIDGDIGHGAPWQWQLYDFSNYENDKTIIWDGKKQKLIFTHFSQFSFDDEGYIPSKMHHIYTSNNMYSEIKSLKSIYDEYYNNVINTKKKYT